MSTPFNYMTGVDIGTGSTKVIALLPDGNVKAVYQQGYATHQPQPGHSEQDPEDILQAVRQGIRQVVQEMGHPPAGICFSSAMHSIMALDAADKPLTPLIIWADNRSQGIADALQPTEEGRALYHQTGVPIHPMTPLCKISWLREQRPDLFKQAAKFVGIKEYILHRLFGRYVIDHSIACATGLFDIHTRQWSAPALAFAGITAAQLPEPAPTHYILPDLSAAAAADLGIPAGTPFIIGASDGCLAQLGSGALDQGHATLTIATSGALRMTARAPVTDHQQRLFNYILDTEHFVTGGPVNNGGVVLQWFVRDFMANHQPADLDIAIQQALEVRPGAEGVICLPYLLGERAPVWDAHARGAFIGIQPQHTSRHFMRAIMEGIGFGLLSIAGALQETAGPIHKISVSGGFTASRGWIQLMADIFEKPMHLGQHNDASALGAAMMGFAALGVPFTAQAAAEEVFTPSTAGRAIYRKHFKMYGELYERLRDFYRG
ncbi:gluconokinase [Chitinophaga agrisoli]|uniref:Gluconokinase n=1 Tax=Chitinophaga agrisoli TaxID=2607653 RepID=A0A5B2W338_9BACT|nr:gluconokinase [Chitinophaga agrisoli]KAA2245062.1 gluconokinase [Chitinophaga agrisoli]